MNNDSNKLYISNLAFEKSTIHVICFILAIILVSWWFGYFEIFHFAPYGPHSWRQGDSASFVQTYYNNEMDFFKPRVHHHLDNNGFGSPSEFPILYYLSAWFWKVFQPHDGILRVVHFSFFAAGLWALSKLTFHLTKDIFSSLMVPLFLWSSPVLAFYSFTFLPNTPALGLSFMGVLGFYYFFKKQNRNWLIGSVILFTLAGLIKVTVLIPYLTILVIFFLERFGWVSFKSDEKIFQKGWINLLLLLLPFVFIGSWIAWVKYYNELHGCGIFITRTRPIWSLVEPAITQTWHWILQNAVQYYYHIASRYLIFGLAFLLLFVFRKKQPKILYTFNLFIFLGVLGSFFVFYRQFFVHEYYAIEMMVFPASVMITFFYVFNNHFGKISNHILTRLIIAAFVIFNLNYSKNIISSHYENHHVFNKDYDVSTYKKREAQAFLKDLGIEYPDNVIAIPDISPNLVLNYLNLQGWSEFAISPQPFAAKIIGDFRYIGAKYLIIVDKKYLDHEPFQKYLKHPMGNFENTIFVFDLRPTE